jgi:hypothetical protein
VKRKTNDANAPRELEIVTNEALLPPTPAEVSTADLLERAAALGPIRTSWESTYTPDDPILTEKMTEHVAQRRDRFRKIVKGTLGACVGVCVLALIVTAVSGGEGSASASERPSGHIAPAIAEGTIEKLEIAHRGKARPMPQAAVVTAWNARPGKRR